MVDKALLHAIGIDSERNGLYRGKDGKYYEFKDPIDSQWHARNTAMDERNRQRRASFQVKAKVLGLGAAP